MVRIVSDTSTLYSTTQAKEAGFRVSPLSVTIAGKTYREFDDISSEQFVDIIRQGHMPTSSQPASGEVEELYNCYPDDKIINVAMAHGLSGTYTSAVAAAQMCDHADKITVINTRTLCGPHRYMVEKALEWAKDGLGVEAIVEKLHELGVKAIVLRCAGFNNVDLRACRGKLRVLTANTTPSASGAIHPRSIPRRSISAAFA